MSTTSYEQYIDFFYTTLLMIWGGSCVGIGLIAIPLVFKLLDSPTKASLITSNILKRQDLLTRFVAIGMLLLFYFKKELTYSYQYFEWAVYIGVLHLYIFGKILSKRLWKMRDKIADFDSPAEGDPQRIRFRRLHVVARYLYGGQILGVIALLYLHAFGL